MSKKLMRKKLALMLANLKKKRPFYTEVEYLKSTGTQWFDLNFIPDNNSGFDLRGDFTQTSASVRFGQRTAAYDRQFMIITAAENRVRLDYGTGSAQVSQWLPTNTGGYNRVTLDGPTKIARIYFNNGTTESHVFTSGDFTAEYSCYLFAFNNAGTALVANNMKVCSFKIYDNGSLVRDFIPVLDWDMTPCMYDKVSGELFYNQGTGDFVAGREIHPVDYLESTGTQYIDTGIKGKNNIDFDYKCIFTNLDGSGQCVGGNWSGASSSTVSLYFGLIRANGNFAYHYDGTASPVVVMNTTVQDTPYTVQGHMWVGEQYMVINGTKSSVGTISSTFTSSLNMYLFGINNNRLVNPSYIKLYYCKIYDNGTLVRDYIPAIDAAGTPFMFDRVTHTCFLNSGSGVFKYPARELEYIESTGTQYIDTGVKSSGSLKAELVAESKITSGSCNIFGLYSNNDDCFGIFQQASTLTYAAQYRHIVPDVGRIVSNVSSPNNKITAVLDKGAFYINGNFIGSKTYYNFSSTQNLLLFALNREPGAGIIGPNPAKVWLCKIYNNSTLVRDFIPAFQDGVAGLLDKANNVFYQNAGTGDFLTGRIVEPEYE